MTETKATYRYKRTAGEYVGHFRGIDRELVAEMRVEAIRRGTTLAPLINEAMRNWLFRQAEKQKKAARSGKGGQE